MTNDRPTVPDPLVAAAAMAYYDRWLDFRQGYLRVPGVQAAVFIDDAIALSTAHGSADVERATPLTTDSLFRIASHSKTFTSTAVFQLAEQGRLRLDDRAGDWLSDLGSSPLADATLRELLTHAAGIVRDSADGDFWQLWQAFPDRDQLRSIVRSADSSILERNERFKYSNIGYGLLGLVLEAASGRSYDELLRATIIERLGLRNTGTELESRRADDYATGYSALSYADHRVPIEHVDTRALASATGFYATASDLVTYFSAHFAGDDRLLSDQSKRQMRHPVWETGKAGRRYAHGLAIVTVGDRTMVGHGGGYPGHITTSVADPDGRIAVSVLTNAIDGPSETLAHAGVRLIDLAASAEPDRSGADLERFTGRFATLWGVFDIAALGGRLYLIRLTDADPAEDNARLEVVDDSTLRIVEASGFSSYGEKIHFEFDGAGKVASMRGPNAATATPLDGYTLPEVVRAPR
ncbi:serine hydrolase domain-containing protein [Solicola gregarius]|uniref:Beta-lactamase family protein n=1 Tax=Solicola gregarius TaxID=2908642 RepID=A0AA46TFX0_9ACTN|nr:serine hydrolase domain-containing protein [Solicola gregarius]UYM04495.1 beta-lactamase family protein [Solicola gregarius]